MMCFLVKVGWGLVAIVIISGYGLMFKVEGWKFGLIFLAISLMAGILLAMLMEFSRQCGIPV